MLVIFQIGFLVFAGLALATIVSKWREKVLSNRAGVFWVVFWVLAVIAVFFPESTSMVAGSVGIGRGADLILYSAIAVLFLIVFRLQVKFEQLNRHLTHVVRKDALNNKKD